MIKYSIVVPVYKSSKSLEILTKQLLELADRTSYEFELILVNDSPFHGETNVALQKICAEENWIKVITLRKTQGQHLALLIGMAHASGDYIITMDDDLQHPVNEIPKLIRAIESNDWIDAIFAVPHYNKKKHSLFRNVGSFILNKTDSALLRKPKGLIKSPFRIITKDIANNIVVNFNATPLVSSLLINATSNIINIHVEHHSRQFGRSNYTLRMLISLTLNNILHYSSLPLKFMGIVGIAGFIFSMLFIMATITRKIFYEIDYPGYTSTVSLISFFGGLNLLAVGLIGEYLIRIIKEQQKPNLEGLIRKSRSQTHI
ncbi:MAG: glycosyltransferase [Chitinophagaceae bacterium]